MCACVCVFVCVHVCVCDRAGVATSFLRLLYLVFDSLRMYTVNVHILISVIVNHLMSCQFVPMTPQVFNPPVMFPTLPVEPMYIYWS